MPYINYIKLNPKGLFIKYIQVDKEFDKACYNYKYNNKESKYTINRINLALNNLILLRFIITKP
jgi:hypothetical protein